MGNYLYGVGTMLCVGITLNMINDRVTNDLWYHTVGFAKYLTSMI